MQPASHPGPLAPPRPDRHKALLAVGVLGIVAAAVAGLAGIYAEVLWFQELHRDIAEGHHHARVRARTLGGHVHTLRGAGLDGTDGGGGGQARSPTA